MSGCGRGGRGAALLKALNSPLRRPGEQSPTPQGISSAPATVPPPAPVPVAVGRGALIQKMRAAQQQQSQQAPAAAYTGAPAAAERAPAAVERAPAVVERAPAAAQAVSDTLATKQALLSGGGGIAGQAEAPRMPLGRGVLGRGAALQQALTGTKPKTPSPVEAVPSGVSPSTHQPRGDPSQPEVRPSPGQGGGEKRGLEAMFQRMAVEDHGRPRGTRGQPVHLAANYIPVRCKNQGVYQYAVSFLPPIDARAERNHLVEQHSARLGEALIFDGAVLGLTIKLPDKETVLESRRRDNEAVMVKVKFVKIVPHEACIPFYGRKLRNVMNKLKMCQVGRNYYLPDQSVPVPKHRLDIWPGFVTSLHAYEGGLMMLCEVSHRVLRTETVLNVLEDEFARCQQQGIKDVHAEFTRRLVGSTVLTRYNNKSYRIDDIAWNMTPLSEFDTEQGKTTFTEYYRKAYNKQIRDREQPLLVHRPTKKDMIRSGRRGGAELICLVPELCNMTGLTDEMRNDFRVMKDLAVHTRVTPNKRVLEMRKFTQAIMSHPEAMRELERWGLSLDIAHLQLEGRQLMPETIYFGRDRKVNAGETADWNRALEREHCITPVALRNWLVIFTSRDRHCVMNWLKKASQVTSHMGIQVQAPTQVELSNDRSQNFVDAIKKNMTDEVQIVVTIFPTSRDDRYNAVKKLCCTEMPVPSQVIIAKTIKDEKKLKSVSVKIALQMNVKLGGELWGVNIPMKGLMVCGIDTYHEGKAGRARSVGGFVASLNSNCTRWYSRCCFQSPGQELIDCLLPCFLDALKQYHMVNHSLPTAIVIYRDGVGDGALRHVSGHEILQLHNAFKTWGEDYQPNFAFVVVQKRINTRLFAQRDGGLDNPGPGTIADHSVTRKDLQDFYLVSQHVRQGTVSPTHYIVLDDSAQRWKVDNLQSLTYKLTHMYYNWPGTVRVPAPCQYAHKLAYLVGQNVRKDPHGDLANRLYFL